MSDIIEVTLSDGTKRIVTVAEAKILCQNGELQEPGESDALTINDIYGDDYSERYQKR